MRIVLDGRPTQPGYRSHLGRGIGLYSQKLIEHLPALGSEDTFLILRDGKRGFDVGSKGENLREISYRVAGWIPSRYEILRNQLALPLALLSAKADLVHFFCHEDASFVFKGKMVLTLHDIIPLVLPHLYRPARSWLSRCKYKLTKRLVKRADKIIADSENTKRDIIKFYSVSEEKIAVIYPGVDRIFRPVENRSALEAAKNKYGVKGDFLFYLGGVDPRKNIKSLLKAFHQLQSRGFSDLSLVIGGELENQREYPGLLEEIERLELDDKVKLTGYIASEDLVLMYNAACLFLFPSLYEGFGLPPLEAMACGTPVISSPNSSLTEVVGDAGVYVDPQSPQDMAGEVELVLSRPELRKTLREKGIKRAEFFRWEKTAREILEIYHDFERDR